MSWIIKPLQAIAVIIANRFYWISDANDLIFFKGGGWKSKSLCFHSSTLLEGGYFNFIIR